MSPIRDLIARLAVPAVAAPMTAVSTPALVAEACAAGIVGSFPTSNCASSAELEDWFDWIDAHVAANTAPGVAAGPIAANLIVSKANTRLDADLECVARRAIPLVITSVGNPAPAIPRLHAAGCCVFVDVASIAHARKALAAGADGLVLLSAGAGGHTGWANPFAFVRAVRAFYDGPLALAGGLSDGAALWSAITLGYDIGLVGTRFIATTESGASPAWRQALVDSTMDDIELAAAPNGVAASVLRGGGGSAGHTVSSVHRIGTTREVVDELRAEWNAARAATEATLRPVDLRRLAP
jgi:nitronate monooxygenase